jgi:CarD family transcriptional regulator
MFRQGEAVVHPARGVGIVTSVDERDLRGSTEKYYSIELLDGLGTRLLVPVSAEDSLGLRPGIKASQLDQVWRVLGAEPEQLPADHKERNRLLEEKLSGGDVLDVAAIVRDLTDRERQQGELTIATKRHLRASLARLAGEVAAAQSVDLDSAEVQIRARMRTHTSDATTD